MEKMKFLSPSLFANELDKIFRELKLEIMGILPACDVEHVGSSAINGAISKGDLDILVRVDKVHLEDAIDKIKTLNFTIKEGNLRTPDLCMLVTDRFNWDVAVQVIAKGSSFEFFIRFRDLLNANPDLVKSYNQLKSSCENLSPEEYRRRKSIFIESVLGN